MGTGTQPEHVALYRVNSARCPARVKGDHPISIADGALAELLSRLLRKAIPLTEWTTRIAGFDELLDPDLPIAAGGADLAASWGAQPRAGRDFEAMRAHSGAVWRYIRDIRSPEDLQRREVFYGPTGRAYTIGVDPERLSSMLSNAALTWSEAVLRTATRLKTTVEIEQFIRDGLLVEMAEADVEKLDLLIRVIAKRAKSASPQKTPYQPGLNDTLDLDLLFAIPLPAWICTSDKQLVELARSTASVDGAAVMTPPELLARLESEATPATDRHVLDNSSSVIRLLGALPLSEEDDQIVDDLMRAKFAGMTSRKLAK